MADTRRKCVPTACACSLQHVSYSLPLSIWLRRQHELVQKDKQREADLEAFMKKVVRFLLFLFLVW